MLYSEGFNKRQRGQHSSEITIALDIHKLADRAAASTRASGATLPERCIGVLTSFLIPGMVRIERIAAYVAALHRELFAELLDDSGLTIMT